VYNQYLSSLHPDLPSANFFFTHRHKRKKPDRHFICLDELRPTQAAVGMRAVSAKRERIEQRSASSRRIKKYLEKRPIPTVLGPDECLHIVDHHHLSLALRQAEVDEAFIVIIDDLSAMPHRSFWTAMEKGGWLHPFDQAGRRIHPARLPKSLDGLAHDPYRDVAWSVRRNGGFEKTMTPYSEFSWANFFRKRIPAKLVERDYPRAVRKAMCLAGTHAAAALPGYAG
jgi:hypothetical protein